MDNAINSNMYFLDRENMIIGEKGVLALQKAHIAVFGLGGVGGSCAEALVRAGIGELTIVDNDTVNMTNINRQVIATHSTIGMKKTEAAAERFLDINPDLTLHKMYVFFSEDTKSMFDFSKFDFVCDAIDSVNEKVLLIKTAISNNTKIISSMGTGNKLSPEKFEIDDIYNTRYCPLAKTMRERLKKEGVKKLTVVYSQEEPIKTGSRTPGSISFVPPVAGMIIASHVIKSILKEGQ